MHLSASDGGRTTDAFSGETTSSADDSDPIPDILPVQADLNGDNASVTAQHREYMEAATTQALREAAISPPPKVSKKGTVQPRRILTVLLTGNTGENVILQKRAVTWHATCGSIQVNSNL